MSKATSYPKDKIKILFLENISDRALQRFKDNGYSDVTKLTRAMPEDELIEALKRGAVVFVNESTGEAQIQAHDDVSPEMRECIRFERALRAQRKV